MLFSNKTQGFFVEVNNYGVLLARTSAASGPMVVEAMKSCVPTDADAIAVAVKEIQLKRTGAYMHARCGVYPAKRLVRRATMDPKRFKEEGYLNEVVNSQFRIEADKYTLAVLSPGDGSDFDLQKSTEKDAVFVGMANDEVEDIQKQLLAKGIYPESLELGSLSTLGGILDYLAFADIKTPTLVLEIDTDSTQSYILSDAGLETTRPIPQGLSAMIPVVQKELGLKDEESARKLFYSNTFDFTGMGSVLTKKLIKELQSSIGFYEVQTGQSIGQVICTMLPSKLGWLEAALANQLGVGLLKIDFESWLSDRRITFDGKAVGFEVDARWLGLISLMLSNNHAFAAEKKS
jgi:Tfp pilus assembly PilM family ATPase